MSIGNIASSIWGPSAKLAPSAGEKPNARAPAPPIPPQSTTGTATQTKTQTQTGSADPFRQLSADIQAKLLQLQATGSDATGHANAASSKLMKPHHPSRQGNDPDMSGSMVPTATTLSVSTTAGATPESGANPSNPSLFGAMRQAIQAYAASAASSSANSTAPIATL